MKSNEHQLYSLSDDLRPETMTGRVYTYERIGFDSRPMVFQGDGTIGLGAASRELFWKLENDGISLCLEIWGEDSLTCRLTTSDGTAWVGYWEDCEQMPILIAPLAVNPARNTVDYLRYFMPATAGRDTLVAVLALVQALEVSDPLIVELGGIPNENPSSWLEDGLSTRVFAWFASDMSGKFHAVSESEADLDVVRRLTRHYSDRTEYHHVSPSAFLNGIDHAIELLYLGTPLQGPDDVFPSACKSNIIVRPAIVGDSVAASRDLHTRLRADGYVGMRTRDQDLVFVRKDLADRDSMISIFQQFEMRQLEDSRMFTHDLAAHVFTHDRGQFNKVIDTNVLVYWPHGFGDWVFLSYILPALEPTNRYWITRFGDDTVSLFDGSRAITPIYSGVNSPHCGDGDLYSNRHFGLRYENLNGDTRELSLPLSIYEVASREKIDTMLWTSNPEIYGYEAYPYHTKGRYLLKYLVPPDRLTDDAFHNSLDTAISFVVDGWITCWVESRLRTMAGFGDRKLCIISRNGYTSIGKNWGHKWRDCMPLGKQREGEECRDFMRLMLMHDSKWMFLVMEDKIEDGDNTVTSSALNCYSYAQLFTEPAGGAPPFALVIKALLNCADLVVGVPTGPYHLAMAMRSVPTVGIWIEHLPEWYDEPHSGALHLISRNVLDNRLEERPGTRTLPEHMCHSKRYLDTLYVPGEAVFEGVRTLLG